MLSRQRLRIGIEEDRVKTFYVTVEIEVEANNKDQVVIKLANAFKAVEETTGFTSFDYQIEESEE